MRRWGVRMTRIMGADQRGRQVAPNRRFESQYNTEAGGYYNECVLLVPILI